ncbi:uncharacterized protein LOC115748606 [Rhodamnia argentea]|uniref:Uncharacterized protein LOC115748606 n=1 Tax=Rhodamnia argentea TaxID=178133 RepID=A0A8B8Q1M9_9MYRT|nr:uncharacterized protein LOC115748606 [Rhodamnia argentea]
MEWSATSAKGAYLDTLKLCRDHRLRPSYPGTAVTRELGSTEFISALAAGMRAKLMVEVASGVSPSTIALAAAARHTGGKLVCIVPEPVLAESKRVIKDTGLKDMVEFKTGNPFELLPKYKNIDFSLVDCNSDDNADLLKVLDVNPSMSVVVANNLVGERKGLEGSVKGVPSKVAVRSTKHPIGEGMEVTVIMKNDEPEKTDRRGGRNHREVEEGGPARTNKSRWICKVDVESGEEHIFRVPRSWKSNNPRQRIHN